MVSGKYIFGAETFLDGGEQDHLQVAAVNRILRPCISGGEPPRLGPDQLAVLVVIAELCGLDRRRRQCVAQPELDQLTHRIRLQIDPGTERVHVRHQFVDVRIDTGGMKAERGAKSPDAGSNHHHLHRRSPEALSSSLAVHLPAQSRRTATRQLQRPFDSEVRIRGRRGLCDFGFGTLLDHKLSALNDLRPEVGFGAEAGDELFSRLRWHKHAQRRKTLDDGRVAQGFSNRLMEDADNGVRRLLRRGHAPPVRNGKTGKAGFDHGLHLREHRQALVCGDRQGGQLAFLEMARDCRQADCIQLDLVGDGRQRRRRRATIRNMGDLDIRDPLEVLDEKMIDRSVAGRAVVQFAAMRAGIGDELRKVVRCTDGFEQKTIGISAIFATGVNAASGSNGTFIRN